MGRLIEIGKAEYASRAETPGKTVSLEVRDALSTRTIEMMHPPGMISGPTRGDVAVEVEAGPRVKIAVAARNYRINIEVGEGETLIYSTDRFGSEVKATIKLDTSGNIDLNGDGKRLVTYGELDAALQLLISAINLHIHSGVTSGSGTSGAPAAPMSLDISAAETQTVRTDG